MSSTIFMSSTMFRYSTIVVTKPHGLRFALGTAICALAALAMLVVAAHAQEREPDRAATLSTAAPMPAPVETSSPACRAPTVLTRLDLPLRHSARRLASGEPLTIVAIGSSSTAGAGASSTAATYPSRLAVELHARFPGHDIAVVNRGINGEETEQMVARFRTAVFAEHPQLVLWQVGTNSVLRDRPLRPHSLELHEGIDELKRTGSDVVLIDPQYAPRVIAKPETPDMVEQIGLTAKEENVALFHRFALMRDWYETQHLPFDTFISPDGLHMNDWSYACMAKVLARAIAGAIEQPVAAAAVHLSR